MTQINSAIQKKRHSMITTAKAAFAIAAVSFAAPVHKASAEEVEPDINIGAEPQNMVWSTIQTGTCTAIVFNGALGIDSNRRPSHHEYGNSLEVFDVAMQCGENGLASGQLTLKFIVASTAETGEIDRFTYNYSGNFSDGLLIGDWQVNHFNGFDRSSYRMTHRNGCWTPRWAGTEWGDVPCNPADGLRMRDQLLARTGGTLTASTAPGSTAPSSTAQKPSASVATGNVFPTCVDIEQSPDRSDITTWWRMHNRCDRTIKVAYCFRPTTESYGDRTLCSRRERRTDEIAPGRYASFTFALLEEGQALSDGTLAPSQTLRVEGYACMNGLWPSTRFTEGRFEFTGC